MAISSWQSAVGKRVFVTIHPLSEYSKKRSIVTECFFAKHRRFLIADNSYCRESEFPPTRMAISSWQSAVGKRVFVTIHPLSEYSKKRSIVTECFFAKHRRFLIADNSYCRESEFPPTRMAISSWQSAVGKRVFVTIHPLSEYSKKRSIVTERFFAKH